MIGRCQVGGFDLSSDLRAMRAHTEMDSLVIPWTTLAY
jgi:hypothetical protein